MPYKDPEDARRQKRRYWADPERAEQRRQYMKEYRQNPEAAAAEQARKADPAVKAYRRAAIAQRRQQDPQYVQSIKDRNSTRRALTGNLEAARSHQRWTPVEDQVALSNLPLLAAALELGRSYEAVAKRRRHLRKQNTNPEENRNV